MIDLSVFRNWQAPREMKKLRAVKGKAARELERHNSVRTKTAVCGFTAVCFVLTTVDNVALCKAKPEWWNSAGTSSGDLHLHGSKGSRLQGGALHRRLC